MAELLPASTESLPTLSETLPILFRDENLIAVNKPSGLLVHRSEIDRHETHFALQLVRDQIGQRVYPVHRLDKPTSGVLLFALDPETARLLNEQFSNHQIQKTYLAVVRGYCPQSGSIDHPLTEELDRYTDAKARQNKEPQQALTHFQQLATIELPVAIESYPQSRYSLVTCQPQTGRKHQIRRHMKHISHPIIGDAKHGKGVHNRYFSEHLNAGRLLLHAAELSFCHPYNKQTITLTAPLDTVMNTLLQRFNWLDAVPPAWRLQNSANGK